MSYSEHFSIKNIPYGIATGPGHPQRSVATRVHDRVIFLKDLGIQSDEEVKQALREVMRISPYSTDVLLLRQWCRQLSTLSPPFRKTS